nr:amidohydrolase family protein [Corynebacterium lactis]
MSIHYGPEDAIDTHAHIFPAAYLDFLAAHGRPEGEIAIARGLGADSTDEELRSRIEWMDRAGVATQIIAVTPQVPSLPDASDSATAARLVNDEYARIVRDYEGRFLAYGALPLPHIDETLAEIPYIFDELGFVGVSISTVTMDTFFLNDPSLDPVWEALNERSAIVNIHPTGSGACSEMINGASLEWVNGAPVEDATATLQLLKADVPRRYPNITFHIAHLGGDLPFIARRIEDNYEDWHAFAASPIQQMRKMYFDAANFHEPSLRLAAETFGIRQILGGSDFPYFQEDKYVRAFSYIREANLTQEEIDAALFANAQRLYGI